MYNETVVSVLPVCVTDGPHLWQNERPVLRLVLVAESVAQSGCVRAAELLLLAMLESDGTAKSPDLLVPMELRLVSCESPLVGADGVYAKELLAPEPDAALLSMTVGNTLDTLSHLLCRREYHLELG